jgi:hypothetical protein
MGWLTGRRCSSTYICPEHRYVVKNDPYTSYDETSHKLDIQRSSTCPTCNKSLINMGTRWRAPRKKDNRSWSKILNGDIWWDQKALDKISENHYVTNLYYTNYYREQLAKRDAKFKSK